MALSVPIQTAELIRERINHELGFTVNIGISDNKLLAKMASDFSKSDRVHTLFKDEMRQKMWPLPVKDLFYVGRASAGKLYKLGIYTIGQLAQADPNVLKAHLKSHGLQIWNFANGIDLSPVPPVRRPIKAMGIVQRLLLMSRTRKQQRTYYWLWQRPCLPGFARIR